MSDLIDEFHAVSARTGTDVGQLFERTVQKIYEAWLTPGDVAVDVGAHSGAHLFPLVKAVGSTGHVYAFEPIAELCEKLEDRLKRSDTGNVTLHQLALSDQSGEANFSYFANRPAFSGLKRRKTPFDDKEGGLTTRRVRQAKLDDMLPPALRVSAIKLDIEGGELQALRGATACLTWSRPLVVFENGRQSSANVYGYSQDDFFSFFDGVDMQVFWLSGERFTPDQWRRRRPCWEFVALPTEQAQFAGQLSGLCKRVLQKAE